MSEINNSIRYQNTNEIKNQHIEKNQNNEKREKVVDWSDRLNNPSAKPGIIPIRTIQNEITKLFETSAGKETGEYFNPLDDSKISEIYDKAKEKVKEGIDYLKDHPEGLLH